MKITSFPYITITSDVFYKKLLQKCYDKSHHSHHVSSHISAVLVDDEGNEKEWGVNNLPPGVQPLVSRMTGENRHIFLNHAERDVIYKAAKKGIPTNGLIMVMPWLPCIECANACISAGIKTLIVHRSLIEQAKDSWEAVFLESVQLLKEAEISVIAYDGLVETSVLLHGEQRKV